jgi:hypothetical protein
VRRWVERLGVGQFPCQLPGLVKQDWQVLGADPVLLVLVYKGNQRDLAVIAVTLDADRDGVMGHGSYPLMGEY